MVLRRFAPRQTTSSGGLKFRASHTCSRWSFNKRSASRSRLERRHPRYWCISLKWGDLNSWSIAFWSESRSPWDCNAGRLTRNSAWRVGWESQIDSFLSKWCNAVISDIGADWMHLALSRRPSFSNRGVLNIELEDWMFEALWHQSYSFFFWQPYYFILSGECDMSLRCRESSIHERPLRMGRCTMVESYNWSCNGSEFQFLKHGMFLPRHVFFKVSSQSSLHKPSPWLSLGVAKNRISLMIEKCGMRGGSGTQAHFS